MYFSTLENDIMRVNIMLNYIKLPDFLNCGSSCNTHGKWRGAKHPCPTPQICRILLPENVT